MYGRINALYDTRETAATKPPAVQAASCLPADFAAHASNPSLDAPTANDCHPCLSCIAPQLPPPMLEVLLAGQAAWAAGMLDAHMHAQCSIARMCESLPLHAASTCDPAAGAVGQLLFLLTVSHMLLACLTSLTRALEGPSDPGDTNGRWQAQGPPAWHMATSIARIVLLRAVSQLYGQLKEGASFAIEAAPSGSTLHDGMLGSSDTGAVNDGLAAAICAGAITPADAGRSGTFGGLTRTMCTLSFRVMQPQAGAPPTFTPGLPRSTTLSTSVVAASSAGPLADTRCAGGEGGAGGRSDAAAAVCISGPIALSAHAVLSSLAAWALP